MVILIKLSCILPTNSLHLSRRECQVQVPRCRPPGEERGQRQALPGLLPAEQEVQLVCLLRQRQGLHAAQGYHGPAEEPENRKLTGETYQQMDEKKNILFLTSQTGFTSGPKICSKWTEWKFTTECDSLCGKNGKRTR